jgi:hypothetical protein
MSNLSYLIWFFLGTVLVTTTQNQSPIRCRKLILAIPPSQISSFEYFIYYLFHFVISSNSI